MQLPGRGHRLAEPPLRQMRHVVEETARDLRPFLDKPFALFGHSMGGTLAFELARLLRDEGREGPTHLFVSGRRAPQIPDHTPHTYDLPEREFFEELRRLNGTPKEVLDHPELMEVMLPLLRADFEVIETYAYREGAPLACPISVYGGLHDEDVTRDELQGWREQTTAAFALRLFRGDHFFINTSRELILQTLGRELYQRL